MCFNKQHYNNWSKYNIKEDNMNCDLLSIFAKRHSYYDINKNIELSLNEIERLLTTCLNLYPSSFNSQDARLILLSGEHHTYFWELVKKELFRVSSIDKSPQIEEKINKFMDGYGTILFFIAPDIASNLQKTYPEYAPQFPSWAEQSNAMLQFMIWSVLAQKNIGASLQHYNPLIDNIVKQQFQIEQTWKFVAQMPFGGIKKEKEAHKVRFWEDRLTVRP